MYSVKSSVVSGPLRSSVTYSILLLLAISGNAFAQSGAASGEVRGRVLDPTDAAIEGCSVAVTNKNTGWSTTLKTNDTGDYRAISVQPGVYDIRVEKAGFGRQTQTSIKVTVGHTEIVNFKLEVGQAPPSSIDVTDKLSLTEPDRSQQSNTIGEREIRQLPADIGDYLTYTGLVPGVTDSVALADNMDFRVIQAVSSGMSFYGNNGRGNSVAVDGGEANDSGGGIRPTLSQEAVQEFQINRSNYSAALGNASGGVINIISKSGTTSFHGSGYGFFRTERLDAGDPFAWILQGGQLIRTKPPSKRQRFGATLGGPLARKLLFFGSFEGQERRESSSVTVLTDTEIFEPTKEQEETLASLPPNSAAILRQLLTSPESTRKLFEANSGIFPYRSRDYKVSFRMDYLGNENNDLTFRYNTANIDDSNPNARALLGASRAIETSRLDHTGLLGWKHTFSASAINEFRVQYSYDDYHVNTAEKFGPEINIPGFGFFNRDIFLPSRVLWRRVEIGDSLGLDFGAHLVRIGGQVLIRGSSIEAHAFFPGRFNFESLSGIQLVPGLPAVNLTALQTFNLGLPQFYQQGFGDPTVASTDPYFGLYIEDHWKATSHLSLDLGLRYEVDDLRDPLPTDRNNFGPRLGFSWSPMGDARTLIRGAYGIFYAPTNYAVAHVTNALGEINGYRPIAQVLTRLDTQGPPNSGNIFRTLLSQGVISVPTPARSITSDDLTQFGISVRHDSPRPPGTVLFRNSEDFASSYSQQASFGIDREVSRNLLLSANYIFARVLKILRARDQNLLPAPVDPTLGISVWSTPFFKDPFLSQENVYESTGNSFYHGLTLELRKRFTNHFSLDVNYTLSKAIDEVVDFNSDFQAANQYDLRAERALSSFDQRHKFVAYASVESPFKPGRGVISDVLGNFTFTPIVRGSSARPFNLLAGFDLNRDRHSTTDRPALAGRNTGIGPDFWTLDVRLTRNISLGERAKAELMVEAFNLFNRLNFRSVNNAVGNIAPPFNVHGRKDLGPSDPLGFTSAFDARQLQLGVRLSF
jgi:Carboxypeptidase regulatory-like domain